MKRIQSKTATVGLRHQEANTPATTVDNKDVKTFEVLYYKRTNKVHKNRGVSKMDGKLIVYPPPSCLVTLVNALQQDDESASDDDQDNTNKKKRSWKKSSSTNGPIYSSINTKVSKQVFGDASSPLQIDDIITLPAYEVQITAVILNHHDDGGNTPAAGNATLKTAPILKSTTMLQRRPLKPLLQSKRAGLAAKKCTITSNWQQRRQPPAQPKRGPRTLDSDSDSDDDMDNAPTTTKSAPARLLSTTRPNPLLNRKRKVPTASVSSATNNKVARPTAAATTNAISFPGAIGSFVIPPSIRKILRPHQQTGIAFLFNCLTGGSRELQQAAAVGSDYRGCILADEMGLGKTLMTIATTHALYRRTKSHRFIIVCPSSLVSNWAAEFDKWVGRASQPKRVVVRKGGQDGIRLIRAFVAVKPNLSEVLIISYDLFRINVQLLKDAKNIGLLVVDEGHRLKNSSGSLTMKALQSLDSEARLLITGTPIQNNLREFHTVADFVCPGLLGDAASFSKEYERPINAANSKTASWEQRNKGLAQSQALDNLTKTFMLRRLQKDILKTMLPPRNEFLLFCRPSVSQCKLYRDLCGGRQAVGSDVAEALTVLTRLRKLCSHPMLLNDDTQNQQQQVDVSQSGKLVVLDHLLQSIRKSAPNDKIVIISNFTTALSVIQEHVLKPRSMTYKRLDGTVAQSERQPLVDSFNRSTPQQCFAFLLSSKAGGCGLNLVGANRCVLFDADFNPATDLQAMARVYRQGQTKPCFIYRFFTSGTVEEVVYQRQQQKGYLATVTVDGASCTKQSSGFTKEELRDCFTLKEDCDCDTKLKIGSSKWPEYNGVDGLEAQGCADQPLLDTVAEQSDVLRFVHIVADPPSLEDDKNESATPNMHAKKNDPSSSEEEEEAEFQDGDGICESSDEEHEFNG